MNNFEKLQYRDVARNGGNDMINKISKEQYEKLCESRMWDIRENFHRTLEEMTGIVTRQYIGYAYYDSNGNYIGDSSDVTVRDLLDNAYIEIEE